MIEGFQRLPADILWPAHGSAGAARAHRRTQARTDRIDVGAGDEEYRYARAPAIAGEAGIGTLFHDDRAVLARVITPDTGNPGAWRAG